MPAKPPPITSDVAAQLQMLGQRIRQRRKQLKISATVAAESAAMSRTSWHRIEKGEPAVTMGAYLSAMAVLGLRVELRDPRDERRGERERISTPIRPADYPQLQQLAWHVREGTELTAREALDIYERNLRHLDLSAMSPKELHLLAALRASFQEDTDEF